MRLIITDGSIYQKVASILANMFERNSNKKNA